MKRILCFLLVVIMLFSLCGCGKKGESPSAPKAEPQSNESQSNKSNVSLEAEEKLASKAVKYLKEQLVNPESLSLKEVQSADDGDSNIFIKIAFTAKNGYGNAIDSAVYFRYDKSTKDFDDLYETTIERSRLAGNIRALETLESGGSSSDENVNIFKKTAYYLDASEQASGLFNIYPKNKLDVDDID